MYTVYGYNDTNVLFTHISKKQTNINIIPLTCWLVFDLRTLILMPFGRCSGVTSALWKQFKQKNSLENRAEPTSGVCTIYHLHRHILTVKSPEQPKISLNGRPNGLVHANSAWHGRLMMLICSNLPANHLILGDILPTQIPTNHYKSWTVSAEGQVMRPTSIHCKRSFWTYSVTCWQSSWTSWHVKRVKWFQEAPGSTQKYWHNSKMW